MHHLKTGQKLPDPALAEQLDIVLGHYEDMLSHYGTEPGMRVARKHIGWYSKGLPGSAEFRAAVNRVHDPVAAREMIRAFYLPLVEREAA